MDNDSSTSDVAIDNRSIYVPKLQQLKNNCQEITLSANPNKFAVYSLCSIQCFPEDTSRTHTSEALKVNVVNMKENTERLGRESGDYNYDGLLYIIPITINKKRG